MLAPLGLLVTLACGGPAPQGGSPSPSAAAGATPSATASATAVPSTAPSSTPTAAPSPTPTAVPPPPVAGAAIVNCPTVPSASALLVLGRLAGTSDAVVRDITDLNNARTDCTIQNAGAVKFVSATRVSYTAVNNTPLSEGRLLVADLTNGASVQVAKFPAGSFGSGAYAFSADGANLTYIASDATSLAWHLLKAGGADQVLATYPAVPGRGVDPDNDDFFLGFSPDGRFVALVQTFTRGTTSDTMPLEVRSVADGSVAFGVDDATMATWGGTGSTLVYRTRAGAAYKWPGQFPLQVSPNLKWIRPHPSPDGRFVIYELRDGSGLGHVYTMDLGDNSTHQVAPDGRGSAAFLTSTLVWYQGERPCTAADQCFLGPPVMNTGVTYINDVGGGNESPSRITEVDDIWPHLSSGRGT